MGTNAFTGQCNAKSTFDGEPQGDEFSTDNIQFVQTGYEAHQGAKKYVQIKYPNALAAGTHTLNFGSGTTKLLYQSEAKLLDLSGTGEVTIGAKLDTQKGFFSATYLDALDREIKFEGTFDGKFVVK